MAWSIRDLFPPWGDGGARPSDNFQYQGGDQVNEKHFDYLWKSCGDLENEVRTALQDIDSDQDGITAQADAITGGGALLGDLTDSAATPQTIWDDTNKEIPDSALGAIDTTTLAADSDNDGDIDTAALAADSDDSGNIDTTALAADSDNDGIIDISALAADTDGDGLIEGYDETIFVDGGKRELDTARLAGGLGTAGQLLQSDGAAASWASVGTGTDHEWTLSDSITVATETSFTLNNFGEWDQILVSFDGDVDSGGSDDIWSIRLNGDTGSNYEYVFHSGGRQTGASLIPFTDLEYTDHDVGGTIFISGRWRNQCVVGLDVAAGAVNNASYGVNTNIISPLSSITILNGSGATINSAFDGTVNIYGRDTP